MNARALPIASICLTLIACAGAQKRPAEPMQQQLGAQPGAPSAEMAPSASPASGVDTFQLNASQADFDVQLADLERLDCANACRALGSLERSAANVCGMTGEKSSTCQDVQRRREDAKGRVRERCGPCP